MRREKIAELHCSIARASAVIGDPWTLLILREAFVGTRRFGDFVDLTGAQPSIVSDRLKRLVSAGVLEQRPYQEHPPRNEYRLTQMGKDLQPILLTLTKWGDTYLDGGDGPPLLHTHTDCGHLADPVLVCGHCRGDITRHNLEAAAGPGMDDATKAKRSARTKA